MFHEEQQLSHRRMKLQLATLPFVFTLLFIWQIVLKRPSPGHSLSNPEVIGWTVVLWLLWLRLTRVRLVTDLKPPKLTVALRGVFRSVKIPLTDIDHVDLITFNALKEFGGFGIRSVGKGRICLAYGSRGVKVFLRNGSQVIIGSQRPEALADAVRKAI